MKKNFIDRIDKIIYELTKLKSEIPSNISVKTKGKNIVLNINLPKTSNTGKREIKREALYNFMKELKEPIAIGDIIAKIYKTTRAGTHYRMVRKIANELGMKIERKGKILILYPKG